MDFVNFTGDENEKEFLQKCLKQWDLTAESEISEAGKLIRIATVFSEMKHRIEELD